MRETDVKKILDEELGHIKMEEKRKEQIRKKAAGRKPGRLRTCAAFSMAVIILGGVTAFAGYPMRNRIQINGEVLPELDAMEIVEMRRPEGKADQDGIIDKNYRTYSQLKEELGTELLDSSLSQENPNMTCRIHTEPDNFAIITVDSFISGDAEVSLKADLILGELQMAVGWDTEYSDASRLAESYTSKQGYRVNVLEHTKPENGVSEKTAVFVAGGIRYSLTGKVSMETMKEIVDSMQ